MYAVSNITLQQTDPEPRQEEQAVAVSVYIHIIIPSTNQLTQQSTTQRKEENSTKEAAVLHSFPRGWLSHACALLLTCHRTVLLLHTPATHALACPVSLGIPLNFPPFIATAGSLAPTHTDEGWGRVVWARVGAWWQAMEGRGRRISPPSRLSPSSCTASCSRSSTALLCSQRSPASTALSTSKSCDHRVRVYYVCGRQSSIVVLLILSNNAGNNAATSTSYL